MAINHADHDHPNTPAARAKCRKRMGNGQAPLNASAERTLAEAAGIVKKATQMTVVPRKRGDGGVVRGMKAAGPGNLKKPGTHLRTIGDLPDVPRMLAYGARLGWAADWDVIVGEPFNDTEARITIKGDQADIAMVWRPSMPDGVWGVFIRNWNSSKTYRVSSVQEAFDAAATQDAWDHHGNYVGL
jgi:hypothetical protein